VFVAAAMCIGAVSTPKNSFAFDLSKTGQSLHFQDLELLLILFQTTVRASHEVGLA
jgi:hypothetical protein